MRSGRAAARPDQVICPSGLCCGRAVQPLPEKYSDFPKVQISCIFASVPSQPRGVSRSSRT